MVHRQLILVATASRARRKILSAEISFRKVGKTGGGGLAVSSEKAWVNLLPDKIAGCKGSAAASAAEVGAAPTSSINQYVGVDSEDLDECRAKRESSSHWKRRLLNVWNLHDTSLSFWIVRIFYHRDVKILTSIAERDIGSAVARSNIEDV